jgi:hypothetical protein
VSGEWLRRRVDYIYDRLIDCTSDVRSIFLGGACYFWGKGMNFEIFHINFQNWDVAHKSW